jgi:hypothetical protein
MLSSNVDVLDMEERLVKLLREEREAERLADTKEVDVNKRASLSSKKKELQGWMDEVFSGVDGLPKSKFSSAA